jgi:hypothetical protein
LAHQGVARPNGISPTEISDNASFTGANQLTAEFRQQSEPLFRLIPPILSVNW